MNTLLKRIGMLILGAAIMVGASAMPTMAAGKETDMITYDGRSIKKDALSQETLEWIEWYGMLSEEEKDMVSYEPSELSETLKTRSSLTDTEDALGQEGNSTSIMSRTASLLPTSGYEPKYNPKYWNKDSNIRRANCYAYAMDVLKRTEGKLQPGSSAGKKYKSLTKSSIISAVKADGPLLGSGRTIKKATRTQKPGKNEYKVALVIAPNADYHWYIQNRNGYWSHKRGLTKVSNLDASNKKIKDPKSCNRNYGSLNYSTWCGYYIVKYTGK